MVYSETGSAPRVGALSCPLITAAPPFSETDGVQMSKTLPRGGAVVPALESRVAYVLVVDDLEEWRERLAEGVEMELRRLGRQCFVTTAGTFSEAMGMLHGDTRYDLLVTDICLNEQPYGFDTRGIDLVEAARKKGIPSIAVSSALDEAEMEQYYRRFGNKEFRFVRKSKFVREIQNALNLIGTDE